jgi:hypothetical protein
LLKYLELLFAHVLLDFEILAVDAGSVCGSLEAASFDVPACKGSRLQHTSFEHPATAFDSFAMG